MKEKVAVAAIKRWVARMPGGAICRKLADRFTRGYPDLQVLLTWSHEFVLLEIECKSPTGKLSALQVLDAERCRAAVGTPRHGKYIRCSARSVSDVRAALEAAGLQALVAATDGNTSRRTP